MSHLCLSNVLEKMIAKTVFSDRSDELDETDILMGDV